MTDILIDIVPLILLFFAGLVLQLTGILSKQDGKTLLNLVFYVSLPALILTSVPTVNLSYEMILLPFISAGIILINFGLSFGVGKFLRLDRKIMGTFLIASMILNIGFTLPFVLSFLGQEGLAMIMIMDTGNGLMVMTFVYYQACRYGGKTSGNKHILKRFFKSPPFWAIILGIILNLTASKIPEIPVKFLEITGDLTIPLLLLTMGVFFTPKLIRIKPLVSVLLIRMGFGLLFGLLITWALGIDGTLRTIILVGTSAPVGFNTLTFSSIEELDMEFGSSLLSWSLLIALFYIPIIILVF
jgi:predicted permease